MMVITEHIENKAQLYRERIYQAYRKDKNSKE
jgi:hypothetical protein